MFCTTKALRSSLKFRFNTQLCIPKPRSQAAAAQARTYARKLDADDSVSEAEWRNRLYSWKTIGLCAIPLLAFGLGTWQVQRLKWKLALLDDVNDKMHRNPVALPLRVTDEEVDRNEYRRVIVHGVFDNANEMLVGPRSYEGEPGFIVITPLVRENGSRVLVNRGWIKREFRDPSTRPESQIAGPTTLVAFVRKAPGKNAFTPKPNPEANEWYSIDLDEMRKHARAENVLLEAIQPESVTSVLTNSRNGIPLGAPSRIDIRNNHLQYLLTWYSLAVITSGMLFYTLRKPSSAASTIKKLRSKAGKGLR